MAQKPLTESEKSVFRALLDYYNQQDFNDLDTRSIVAFHLADGTYRFSLKGPTDVLVKIAQESLFSDRLLVIVTIAYLEDQIRTLLQKFLTDDDVTRDLLDPNKSLLSSLMPMANLAFSLGLLAEAWYELLKRMGQLRNKFAHIPAATSFADLIKIDPKTAGLIESIIYRYKQFPKTQEEDTDDIRKTYTQLFLIMFNLTQFAIDHIASAQTRQSFNSDQIVGINIILGMTRENIRVILSTE